jgi:hypothetical protein
LAQYSPLALAVFPLYICCSAIDPADRICSIVYVRYRDGVFGTIAEWDVPVLCYFYYGNGDADCPKISLTIWVPNWDTVPITTRRMVYRTRCIWSPSWKSIENFAFSFLSSFIFEFFAKRFDNFVHDRMELTTSYT